jgi:hypothetical protein
VRPSCAVVSRSAAVGVEFRLERITSALVGPSSGVVALSDSLARFETRADPSRSTRQPGHDLPAISPRSRPVSIPRRGRRLAQRRVPGVALHHSREAAPRRHGDRARGCS